MCYTNKNMEYWPNFKSSLQLHRAAKIKLKYSYFYTLRAEEALQALCGTVSESQYSKCGGNKKPLYGKPSARPVLNFDVGPTFRNLGWPMAPFQMA